MAVLGRLAPFWYALVLTGCNWSVPHDNPVDPDSHGYRPVGHLNVTVLSTEDGSPVVEAEVRIPQLGVFALADTLGIARLKNLSVGTYRVFAERRGDGLQAFRQGSDTVNVLEGQPVSKTLQLTPLPPVPGAINLQVITLSQAPIDSATVIIPALGRFAVSNAGGNVRFSDVPVGNYWVSAFRTEEPVFARDSINVTVNQGATTQATIRLDALPRFLSAQVNCFTTALRADQTVFVLRLKARVQDPDGPQDIRRVEWSFPRERWGDPNPLTGTLAYNADTDSAFWAVSIPADSLPSGNIDAARDTSFFFTVFDASGNSARTDAALARVIHRAPNLNRPDVPWVPQPNLRWVYEFSFEFQDHRQFNYLLRVYRDEPEPRTWYDVLLPSNGTSSQEHQIAIQLPQGNYYWYVWVIDNFGNLSRSIRGHITPQ